MKLLAALALLLLLAGCGTDVSTGDKGFVSGGGAIREIKVADRKPAPAISGTTLQGAKVSVAGLAAGRPTVLNVWGSWCGECRLEAPALNSAARQLGQRASFVGINVRDAGARDSAIAFERRFGALYPSIFDPSGRTLLDMPKGVPVYAVPTTIVLDTQGRVAATVNGELPSARTLVELVESAK